MIPYFPQPAVTFGPFTIHAFGVCAAIALITGYSIVNRRAKRLSLDPDTASRIYLITVLAGLLGGFLWSAAKGEYGISSAGLLLGGFAGLLLQARIMGSFGQTHSLSRTPALGKLIDLYAFALPFVLTIARLGCFLAHDHIGRRTEQWIGVQFPGGTRFDLGLLQAVLSAITAAFVLWLSRRSMPAGALTVLTGAMLAAANFGVLPLSRELSA